MDLVCHKGDALPNTTFDAEASTESNSAPIAKPTMSGQSIPRNNITSTSWHIMLSLEKAISILSRQTLLKDAGKMLWRPDGESIVDLNDLPACMRHATKGCFRSAMLAFCIRACCNLLLALLRSKRQRRFAMIRNAMFGEATWRFSLVLGTFTGLYKFLLNAFPILFPRMRPSLSGAPELESPVRTKQVQLHDPQQCIEIKTRFPRIPQKSWHAALAGAIAGGLATMWEKDGKTRDIVQHAFFKGLQGSYNSFAAKHNFHVPHGDVVLFSLAVGQIIYAFFLRPDTLPPSYQRWIGEAGRVPLEAIHMNFDLFRRGTFDIADLEKICKEPYITPANLTHLDRVRASYYPPSSSVVDPSLPRYYAPCSAFHPTVSSCLYVPLFRSFAAFRFVLPLYGAIHFVPSILFKWQAFMRNPKRMALRAGLGSLRSAAFWGTAVLITNFLLCSERNLHRLLTELKRSSSEKSRLNPFDIASQRIIDLLLSRTSYWMLGFFAGLSVLIEEKKRRAELVMYVLPKALESMWIVARGKGLRIGAEKWGNTLLATMGMSMLMSTYQNDPRHMSGFVRQILYQLIGPN